MTAKECIKAKCADCFEGRGDCSHTDCHLFGLRKAKGGCNRSKAIRDYCSWCRNGLPYWVEKKMSKVLRDNMNS